VGLMHCGLTLLVTVTGKNSCYYVGPYQLFIPNPLMPNQRYRMRCSNGIINDDFIILRRAAQGTRNVSEMMPLSYDRRGDP
jgi:hypothetical protein